MYKGFIDKEFAALLCSVLDAEGLSNFTEHLNSCHKSYMQLHPFQREMLSAYVYDSDYKIGPKHEWIASSSGVSLRVTDSF